MKHFKIDCVASDSESINRMKETAEETTYEYFRKETNPQQLRLFEAICYEDSGLKLETDRGVSFYRSTFRGAPCVYFVHSGIEHIFTETGLTDITQCHLMRSITQRGLTRSRLMSPEDFLKGKRLL